MANLATIQPIISTLVIAIILLGLSVLFILLIKRNQSQFKTDKYMLINDMSRLNDVLRLIDYRIKSSKKPIYFTLLLVSIDEFYSIKDIVNEEGATEYLKKVIEALRGILPIGGKLAQTEEKESFLIYIPEYYEEEILQQVAQRFKSIVEQSFIVRNSVPMQKTASVSVTTYPAQGQDVVVLINNLLVAMYTAKKAGGNELIYYSNELEKDRHYTDRYKEIKQSIDKGQIAIRFNPVINTDSEKLEGTEIVVCKVSNDGTYKKTEDFGRYIEEYDDEVWFTTWCLEKSILMNQLILHDRNKRDFFLAIEVGHKFLTDTISAIKLQNLLARYNIDANNVIIEVADVIENDLGNRFVKNLMQIQGIGMRVAAIVEDVDKDLSKLIETFDVDIIKIKASDALNNNNKKVQELLKLAYNHRKKVIITEIEEEKEFEKIKNKTVAYVQGTYFGECISNSQLLV